MYQLHPLTAAALAEQRHRDHIAEAHASRLARQARNTQSAIRPPQPGRGWARQLLAFAR